MQRGYLRQAFHAADKALDWWFGDRRAWARDYRKLSKKIERFTDHELVETMPKGEYVRLGDVRRIFTQIGARLEYDHSYENFMMYIEPVFQTLIEQAQRGDIPCFARVEEDLNVDGRFRVRDILAAILKAELPEGASQDTRFRTETIFVPIMPDIDETTQLGRIQRWFNTNLPLATPSTEGEEKEVTTEYVLNLKRPLIMAVGYASDYHGIGRAIAKYDIPKLEDTMFERSNFDRRRRQKAAEPRYYRGHRVDK
jgi:hypothetical protein